VLLITPRLVPASDATAASRALRQRPVTLRETTIRIKVSGVSGDNIERHRRLVEAFNARDIDAFLAYCDPQIEFHSTFAAIGGAVYHGHDGMRRWHRDLEDVWGDDFRAEPEAFFDIGEHTVAVDVLHGRGRQSGAEVALPAAQVARWRDGLIVWHKAYAHKEDAFRDLGVSEDALEPIVP
jgi:ketosteroid isomerase-like protein